jgi:pilus assembly protein Flp/PilA
MPKFLRRFAHDQSGATAIEYGLIAALMAVAIIAAVGALSPKLSASFGAIGDKMAVS